MPHTSQPVFTPTQCLVSLLSGLLREAEVAAESHKLGLPGALPGPAKVRDWCKGCIAVCQSAGVGSIPASRSIKNPGFGAPGFSFV